MKTGASAAEYMTCLALITNAAAIAAQIDAVPTSVISASWAAPAMIATEVNRPIPSGIGDSEMATPSTKPNGTAGTRSGNDSLIA